MEYRLLDLIYALAILLLLLTSGGLIVYAVKQIGIHVMQAWHTYLTCRDYHRGGELQRGWLLKDPTMRGILTLAAPFQHFFPWPRWRRTELKRLAAYRHERALAANRELIWDPRLAALLTPDEHAHLYGAMPSP
jgi:hypothetical protein